MSLNTTAQTVQTYITIDGLSQYTADSTTVKMNSELNERDSVNNDFNRVNDSLFLAKQYLRIIERCENYDHSFLAADAKYYLIGSYDALGLTELCDSMLIDALRCNDTSINTFNSIAFMSSGHENLAMLSYLSFPENRKKIERLIVGHYESVARPRNKRIAKALWHLLLNDQYIRGMDMSKYNTDSSFPTANENNLLAQYSLYKDAGHIFSKIEVGAGLHHQQFLLLAHEGVRQRRDWYLRLIRDGAKQDYCELHRVPDFVLRTELQQKGPKQFLLDLEQREAELRIEYNLPDYYYQFP